MRIIIIQILNLAMHRRLARPIVSSEKVMERRSRRIHHITFDWVFHFFTAGYSRLKGENGGWLEYPCHASVKIIKYGTHNGEGR